MPPQKRILLAREDDPQWLRFWNMYPCHSNKKDARKAWAQLDPAPALVERMLCALAWQAPLWAKQGYGMPYPATWLRGERWEDEPPIQQQMSSAASTIFMTLGYPDDDEETPKE